MIKKLDSNNHSVFLLYYHLVFATKYRRKVLTDKISDYLKDHFVRLLEPKGITVEEWNHDEDHVYILFRSVKRDFPQIKHYLWKEMFWSRSYCLLTTGGAPIEVIRTYIESQGIK